MKITIKNLLLRTIIGLNDWERTKKQDVLLNLCIDVADEKACISDNIHDSVDYKTLTKKIIKEVESVDFFLIEKLAGFVMNIIFENEKVTYASVEVGKPHALRFSESVSILLERTREQSHH